MSDEIGGPDDNQDDGRQNIYTNPLIGSEKLYSARQVSEMTGYSPVTIRWLARELQIGQRIDGRPFFTIMDVSEIRKRKEGGTPLRVKKPQEHRQTMDGRATMWELFTSNRKLIQSYESVIRKIQERAWELSKSITVLAGDLDEIKKQVSDLMKKKERGRAVLVFGDAAPLTRDTYGAEAA